MPGRGQPRQVRLDQLVPHGDLPPRLRIASHLRLQRPDDAVERRRRDPEPCGDTAPHPFPAEDVAIDHVERLVMCRRRLHRPKQMAGKLARIGHVGQPMPLRGRSRKDEWPPGFAAQRGMDRQRRPHVHRIADRLADHRVRPVHAPGETVACRRGEQFILLRIIEVLDIQPPLLLAERRLRQRTFAVSLERPQIVLEPGDQRDMARPGSGRQAIQQVAHHRGIDADILRLAVLPRPGGDKHRIGRDVGQRRTRVRRIVQVCDDGPDAVLRHGSACQSVHGPSLLCQQCRRRAADNPARPYYQRRFRHDPRTLIV